VIVSAAARISALFEGVAIAIDALRANKVRAALTILGIAVGVFVVVAMAAAIHGINVSVAKDIESAGATTFFVERFPVDFNACDGTDETCPWIHNPPIRLGEAALLGRLPSLAGVTTEIDFAGSFKHADRTLAAAQIQGFSPGWTNTDGGDINPGRSFTVQENASGAQVVLINDMMAERLFPFGDPVGKSVLINNSPYEIIGLYHYHPSFLFGGERALAILPIQTLLRHFTVREGDAQLIIKPRENVGREEAIDDVTATLRGARGLRPAKESNFFILTQDLLFSVYNKIFGVIFLVTFVLSAVGLMVGGVGVVAIMMISVTERTREIGVRKALGATKWTILWQFLVESVTLTGIGSVIGLLVGWGIAVVVRSTTPIAASVPPLAVLAALGSSVITGIMFGIYPAYRAARLDPVTALRYE
jgi:putative ABC transport system permease protein